MTQTTRASILTETQSTLIAAATAAGSRVYIARSDVFATVELPAIALDIDRETETIQIDGQAGLCSPYMDRSSDLQLMLFAKGATDALADTARDALVEAVRVALLGDVTWLTTVHAVTAVDVQYVIGDGDGQAFLAGAKMTIGLSYSHDYGAA
tara:strand:+ start:1825 stop:2283 length:459 start_codon:yes stop_codon:yes gene_type:complete